MYREFGADSSNPPPPLQGENLPVLLIADSLFSSLPGQIALVPHFTKTIESVLARC
jgi:hypothetical protein